MNSPRPAAGSSTVFGLPIFDSIHRVTRAQVASFFSWESPANRNWYTLPRSNFWLEFDIVGKANAVHLDLSGSVRSLIGAVAQLVERFHGMEEARGSIPLSSTIDMRNLNPLKRNQLLYAKLELGF